MVGNVDRTLKYLALALVAFVYLYFHRLEKLDCWEHKGRYVENWFWSNCEEPKR